MLLFIWQKVKDCLPLQYENKQSIKTVEKRWLVRSKEQVISHSAKARD